MTKRQPGYWRTLWAAAAGLLRGMRVTLATLLRPSVTVRYPEERLPPFEGFRGALVFDPETCICCGLCAKACPSSCISIEAQPGEGAARLSGCSIDLARCSFCRLCEEACPTQPKSVRHSEDYELVFASRAEMVRFWKPGASREPIPASR
jgi:formate hydrogenlyase subunit 6/NADH:ubiquinone oxidoreductase subunit I